jgi:hypothetical protein
MLKWNKLKVKVWRNKERLSMNYLGYRGRWRRMGRSLLRMINWLTNTSMITKTLASSKHKLEMKFLKGLLAKVTTPSAPGRTNRAWFHLLTSIKTIIPINHQISWTWILEKEANYFWLNLKKFINNLVIFLVISFKVISVTSLAKLASRKWLCRKT